jgi:hydroxymethylglutaryl-CoA synthase
MKRDHPINIGILAIDIYFPKTSVRQSDLEEYDGVPKGKYTIGLGQSSMSYVGDREDIVSISLSCVNNILEKFQISPLDIGRLEVGTETVIDKSKSVKTYLMQLFKNCGNHDIEGVDNKNACYGGTNALLNAINWIESSSWDGRYALVVAADIAVYKRGPARPTGGCGAVAMLIGPNAPIVVEHGLKGSYFDNVYDFYKPELPSEYPTVSGEYSIQCYLTALEGCYNLYRDKYHKKNGGQFTLDDADYMLFHTPYNKLIQKAVARLYYEDYLKNPNGKTEYQGLNVYDSNSKLLETELIKRIKNLYSQKVEPGTLLSKELGNCYCASLYSGLISLIENKKNELIGKRIVLFSYGSGLSSTMFSFRVVDNIENIARKNNINHYLSNRIFVHPEQFNNALSLRETRYLSNGYEPSDTLDNLFPGSYFLERVDENYKRYYKKTPTLHHKL